STAAPPTASGSRSRRRPTGPTCCRRCCRAGATRSMSASPTAPASTRRFSTAARSTSPSAWAEPMIRRLPIPLLAAGALAAAGCGAGAGTAPNPGSQLISRDFGAKVIVLDQQPKIEGSDTVMRLLQRNTHVTTRFGGKFVQSINGVSGGTTKAGDGIDWFFYVNGVEGGKGAAEVRVHDGDRVWWDNHDWAAVMDTPAVVGS